MQPVGRVGVVVGGDAVVDGAARLRHHEPDLAGPRVVLVHRGAVV